MANTSSYLTKLPVMPIIDVPATKDLELARMLRSRHQTHDMVTIAVSTPLIPVACVKMSADHTCDFRSTLTYNENQHLVEQARALADLPENAKYANQYIWLNNQGESLYPRFAAKSNLMAQVEWAMLGLWSMWKDNAIEGCRGVIWRDGMPSQLHGRHLVYFMLAMLPDPQYREVLYTFNTLGQGFVRYWYYWIKTGGADKPLADALMPLVETFKPTLSVYGSKDVLDALREEGLDVPITL